MYSLCYFFERNRLLFLLFLIKFVVLAVAESVHKPAVAEHPVAFPVKIEGNIIKWYCIFFCFW